VSEEEKELDKMEEAFCKAADWAVSPSPILRSRLRAARAALLACIAKELASHG